MVTGISAALGPVLLPALLLLGVAPAPAGGLALALRCTGFALGLGATWLTVTLALLPLPAGSQQSVPYLALLLCAFALVIVGLWPSAALTSTAFFGWGCVLGVGSLTTSAHGYWALVVPDRDQSVEPAWVLDALLHSVGIGVVALSVFGLGHLLTAALRRQGWAWGGIACVGWLIYHALWEIRVGRGALPEDAVIQGADAVIGPLSRGLSQAPISWWVGLALALLVSSELLAAQHRRPAAQ